MSKRVYISADYANPSGDRDVVNVMKNWETDNCHKTDFVDIAAVVSGSVSLNPDCRSCDLKVEFNRQINISSSVIIVIGDKTKERIVGSRCECIQKNAGSALVHLISGMPMGSYIVNGVVLPLPIHQGI